VVEARADAIVPASPEEAYAAVSDIEHADWLPAVRGLRHIGGPKAGVGARYEVEVGLIGRHLRGVLVCEEATPHERLVMVLEEGLDLTVSVDITKVSGGSRVEVAAEYSVGGGILSKGVEQASIGAARREVARAVEQLAARFGRKAKPSVKSRQ
jgi:carbon monoxide dehydrogenase subunit G